MWLIHCMCVPCPINIYKYYVPVKNKSQVFSFSRPYWCLLASEVAWRLWSPSVGYLLTFPWGCSLFAGKTPGPQASQSASLLPWDAGYQCQVIHYSTAAFGGGSVPQCVAWILISWEGSLLGWKDFTVEEEFQHMLGGLSFILPGDIAKCISEG